MQHHQYKGRTSGHALFLLACFLRAAKDGRKIQPACITSLNKCMQARITCTHSFYLGIDDFEYYGKPVTPLTEELNVGI